LFDHTDFTQIEIQEKLSMKYRNLLMTVLATTITASVTTLVDLNLRPVNAESSMMRGSKMSGNSVLASGEFMKSEHPTTGMAQIVMKNGQKYLKFDDNFKSDSGPDLFVILHRQGSPKSYAAKDYISLGRLQKLAGQQMYKIPNRVNVANYKSAVIWCRKFNATFGYAPLG
jgi:Electron transfer DM13